ncbi:MAG: hypothetical protein OQJ81_01880, partial [Melioribacteraceae bacterium]|nr:hypothetical protein [Melioribacteraceae bacterium]
MYKLKLITNFLILFFILSPQIFASIDKNEKKSFDVSFGGQLVVDTDKGSLIVETHNSSKIEVEILMTAKTNDDDLAEKLFNDFSVSYDHSGSDLKIVGKFKGGKSWLKNLFGGSSSNKLNVKFIITVPEKYNVDLNTSGGGIAVGDLEGLVEARTSGGGLTFGNIHGDINGKTSGGGITIGECAGNIKISTSGSRHLLRPPESPRLAASPRPAGPDYWDSQPASFWAGVPCGRPRPHGCLPRRTSSAIRDGSRNRGRLADMHSNQPKWRGERSSFHSPHQARFR